MPELPEVETIARTLEPLVQGRIITRTHVLLPKVWQGGLAPHSLEGQSILGVGRRAKLLLIAFAPNGCAATGLAFHLKMTGRLFVYPEGTQSGPHTRMIFDLDDARRLFFDDIRTFGYVRALSPAECAHWSFWQGLGPEPLEINDEDFLRIFAGKNRGIKALLLDQTALAGIGNIYADESLFRAGIRPDARSASVSPETLRQLRRHLTDVLRESIEACGSSIRDYRTARGDAGAFQNAFRVYGRAGQDCLICGKALHQGKVAGRTTVWCPNCQA